MMTTDLELIKRTHPSGFMAGEGERIWAVYYRSGKRVTIVAPNKGFARRIAQEYGTRFLLGDTPKVIQWCMEDC